MNEILTVSSTSACRRETDLAGGCRLDAQVGGVYRIPDRLGTFHARARGSGASAEAARVGRTPRDSGAAWSVCVSMPRAKDICCYHFTFLIYCSPRPTRSCRQLAVGVMMVQVTDGRAGTCSTDERSGIGLGGLQLGFVVRSTLVDVLPQHSAPHPSKKAGRLTACWQATSAGEPADGRESYYPRSSLGVPRQVLTHGAVNLTFSGGQMFRVPPHSWDRPTPKFRIP